MSYTKKEILSEVLGVPENIENVSKKIYKFFIGELEKDKDFPIDSDIEYSLELKGSFKIADFKIKKVGINVLFATTDQITEPVFYGMAFNAGGQLDPKNFQLIPNVTDEIVLTFKFALPENRDVMFGELLNTIKSDESEFLSSITHELQHGYENFKKPIESSKERARYSGVMGVNFSLPPVRRFLHYLYFISATENVVRPVEVNSLMKSSKIKRDKFVSFLTDTRIYKTYKEASEFTLEKFKSDLMDHMDRINEILTEVGEIDSYTTDEQKVNRLIELLYINLTNEIIGGYKDILQTDFFEAVFGFSGAKAEAFEKFVNEVLKYKNNPMKFFEYEIYKMHQVSTNMMKKLSKMYALIDNKKSIKNWDIHDKITKRTQIETHYRY